MIKKCIMNDGPMELNMIISSFSGNIHELYIILIYSINETTKTFCLYSFPVEKNNYTTNYIQNCNKKIGDISTKTIRQLCVKITLKKKTQVRKVWYQKGAK